MNATLCGGCCGGRICLREVLEVLVLFTNCSVSWISSCVVVCLPGIVLAFVSKYAGSLFSSHSFPIVVEACSLSFCL